MFSLWLRYRAGWSNSVALHFLSKSSQLMFWGWKMIAVKFDHFKGAVFSYSLVNMGIKAVPSEEVTITACFQCVFPWRKRICKPAAGQHGCDGMKLKKVDARSHDTAEIITDLLYEHKFVLGGREKFTNHVRWCNFPSAFGINCVEHTDTGLIASENERTEEKTTPWMCVPNDPGHRSPKSTTLWLDRQRADPILHRTPGYHWWSYNPQALSPSHLTYHLQHIPQGQSVDVIIIVYSRVHNPVTYPLGSAGCFVLVCTAVVGFNKPICNTFCQ